MGVLHSANEFVYSSQRVTKRTRALNRSQRRHALDVSYRRAIARLESLPENQSGADKTWVERAIADWRKHYASAVRVR
jgi:hypothetical protein